MATTPIPGPVRTQLQAILSQDSLADCIALVWPTSIEAPSQEVVISKVPLRIVYCDSELAIREQLVLHEGGKSRLVILSPFDETHLSKDVLARLWGYEPKRISPWRTLQQLLKVNQIDPRLTQKKYRWIAESLVSSYDLYHGHIRFGETLDFDKAWEAVALGHLGYTGASLDLDSLFEWSLGAEVSAKVASLPEGISDVLADWLQPRLSQSTQLIEVLWSEGHAGDILAVGLVCHLLYSDKRINSRSTDVLGARGQFTERLLGGNKVDKAVLQSFGDSAVAFASRFADKRKLGSVFTFAEQTLSRFDSVSLTVESDLLPASFSLRLDQFSTALSKSIAGKSMEPTFTALASLRAHQLADVRGSQINAAELAVRICVWLQRGLPNSSNAQNIIRDYVAEGAFLDWARSKIWAGDEHEQVSSVYQKLTKKCADYREVLNEQFSEYLPSIARGDKLGRGIWPVESAIDGLLVPLAKQQPILLLVIDGMSQAVYRELCEDLVKRRWVELQREDSEGAECLLSALPSITKASRYSLLAGLLGEGVASGEKKAFSGHSGLKKASPKSSPVLFHKSDLEQAGTGGLSSTVREAVAGSMHRVVAAVINTVDDQLSSNAQLSVNWSIESLIPLSQLLEAAKESGRLVVFTSDHGHVLDHDMGYRKASSGGERYKQVDEKVMSGEVLLEGDRVIQPDNKAILPWSEKVRYASKKRGYHGGGSLQELIIPFGVFSNIDTRDMSEPNNTVDGWQEVPYQTPSWWSLMAEHSSIEELSEPITADKVTKAKVGKRDEQTLDLFAPAQSLEVKPLHSLSVADDWVNALTVSPIYQQMRERTARTPISDDQVITLLRLLDKRDGQQMLAAVVEELKIPAIRVHGLLAGLQKLLNVDGYRVLAIDRSTKTVKLDIELLRKQFEI